MCLRGRARKASAQGKIRIFPNTKDSQIRSRGKQRIYLGLKDSVFRDGDKVKRARRVCE